MSQCTNNSHIKENTGRQFGIAFCLLGRSEAILLARHARFDFAVVDMEHGPLGLDALGQMAAAGLCAQFPVWGRVSGPQSPDLSRVLDCGVTGIIIPHVDTVHDAERIARSCRFAPVGSRSIPGPIPTLDYAILPAPTFCKQAEANVTVAAMIESADGLAAVEEIAAVQGIDMLVIGTNDLADGLGIRGQIDHPMLYEAFQRISKAAMDNGKRFGVMGLPPRLIDSHASEATFIVATNDTNLLVDGGTALLTSLRYQR